MIDGNWISAAVAVVGFGYLGYSMRSLSGKVTEVKDSLAEFKISAAELQGDNMTFTKCGKAQKKCAADVKEKIAGACKIAKHHRHTETGEVVIL